MLCFHLAIQRSGKLAEKLFSLSDQKFGAAIQRFPNSPHVLFHWGRMLYARTFGTQNPLLRWSLLTNACEKLKSSLILNNQLSLGQFQLHQVLFFQICWQLQHTDGTKPHLFKEWEECCLNLIRISNQEFEIGDVLSKIDWISELIFRHHDESQGRKWLNELSMLLNQISKFPNTNKFEKEILELRGMVYFYLCQRERNGEMESVIQNGAKVFEEYFQQFPQSHIPKFSHSSPVDLMYWYSISLRSPLLKPKIVNYVSNLTSLILDFTYFSEKDIFETLFEECPQLYCFSARYCYHILLPKCCHATLQELDLTGCFRIGTFNPNASQHFGLPNLM